MKLNRVAIKNYRSIKDITIHFDPACRVLVGINESGKSNILTALNLLDPEVKSSRKDIREPLRGEKQPTEAYVRFIFKLDADDATEVFEKLKTKVLTDDIGQPIINFSNKDQALQDFCASREGLYVADILSGKKYFSRWSIVGAKIIGNWKKVLPSCPPELMVSNKKGDSFTLKQYSIVNTDEFVDLPKEHLQDLKPDELAGIIGDPVNEYVEENLPSVLFWDYDESNLLPPRINLQKFCDNPDTCIPLKRMFNLNGIWEIKKEIEAAKQGSANTLKNLLRRIAEATSKHFHKTWKEYDDINFSLAVDGEDITAGIEDKSNHFELSQRSDGFKRFVTFLLLVSVEAETELLTDTLLLIDEPEIGLHPTGCRYLRDELIKISANNHVVFSTHSIFMIDNRLTRRHLIVKKEKEITQIAEVTDSNIQEEEVIYKSLGYSIFSNLKELNIIFEGWRDKKIFETALTKVPSTYSGIKDPLGKVGHCFAQGVKQIQNITPLFEAGERKCLILSDNDAPAVQMQKEHQAAKGYGVWKRYDEIDATITAITGEDFLKDSTFTPHITTLQTKYSLSDSPNLSDAKGKLYGIRQWLSKNGCKKEDVDAEINKIKDEIFENLQNHDIDSSYYKYLTGVVSQLSKF